MCTNNLINYIESFYKNSEFDEIITWMKKNYISNKNMNKWLRTVTDKSEKIFKKKISDIEQIKEFFDLNIDQHEAVKIDDKYLYGLVKLMLILYFKPDKIDVDYDYFWCK